MSLVRKDTRESLCPGTSETHWPPEVGQTHEGPRQASACGCLRQRPYGSGQGVMKALGPRPGIQLALWEGGASRARPPWTDSKGGAAGTVLGTPRPGSLYPHSSCGHLVWFSEPTSGGRGWPGDRGEVCSCEVSLPVTSPDRGQRLPGLDIPKDYPQQPCPFL